MTVLLAFVLLATGSFGCYGATITIRSWWSRLVAVCLGFVCIVMVSALWWFLSFSYVHSGLSIWPLCVLLLGAAFGVASLVHGVTRNVQPDAAGKSRPRRQLINL